VNYFRFGTAEDARCLPQVIGSSEMKIIHFAVRLLLRFSELKVGSL